MHGHRPEDQAAYRFDCMYYSHRRELWAVSLPCFDAGPSVVLCAPLVGPSVVSSAARGVQITTRADIPVGSVWGLSHSTNWNHEHCRAPCCKMHRLGCNTEHEQWPALTTGLILDTRTLTQLATTTTKLAASRSSDGHMARTRKSQVSWLKGTVFAATLVQNQCGCLNTNRIQPPPNQIGYRRTKQKKTSPTTLSLQLFVCFRESEHSGAGCWR